MEDYGHCSQMSVSDFVYETVVVVLGVESEVKTEGKPDGRL